MLVSHRYKFIYIKTTKTAGTSVEIFLERFCRPDPENIAEGGDELVGEWGIVGLRSNDRDRLRRATFWNHMTAVQLKKALSLEVWNSYVKVCNVRNPYDQVVSRFWMDVPHPDRQKLRKADLGDIKKRFKLWAFNGILGNRSRKICFIDGNCVADRVIRYESLEADVQVLCHDLGMEFGELGAFKTNIRTNKAPFQYYYDEETAALVQERFNLEFEQFCYDREAWREVVPA